MTTAVPMLADFSIRLAFGLAITILLLPWKTVPLRFFRIHMQVVLGLLVLSALDQARAGGPGLVLWTVVGGRVLGVSRVGRVGPRLAVFGSGHVGPRCPCRGNLADGRVSPRDLPALWAINAAEPRRSGFFMGSTLTAMLLGHQYLTAPSMTIDPLKRVLVMMAWALVVRLAFAGMGMWATRMVDLSPAFPPGAPNIGTILAVRWGVGFVAFAVATWMTWRTVQIRSTQSATGILYITMIFVLFGELTSLVLAEPGRVIP